MWPDVPERDPTLDFARAYNLAKCETQSLAQVPEIATTKYFDLKGEQITNVPKLTLSYGLNYSILVAGFCMPDHPQQHVADGYDLAGDHATFTYQRAFNIVPQHQLRTRAPEVELSVMIRNLFDADYYTSASTWSASAAQPVTWGAPQIAIVWFRSKL